MRWVLLMDFFLIEICATRTQVSQSAHPGLHLWPGRTFIFHCVWGDSQEGGIFGVERRVGKGEGRLVRGGRRSNLFVDIVSPLECQTSMKRL